MGSDAYSYVFQGQSGYLDHALANQALLPFVRGVTEWHINADEPVALDYDLEWTASVLKNPNQQTTLYIPARSVSLIRSRSPHRRPDPGGTRIDGATVYLGLKSSDDINTAFDLKIELESDGTTLGSGELLCVRNVRPRPRPGDEPARDPARRGAGPRGLGDGAPPRAHRHERRRDTLHGRRGNPRERRRAQVLLRRGRSPEYLVSSDSGATHFHSNGTACAANARAAA